MVLPLAAVYRRDGARRSWDAAAWNAEHAHAAASGRRRGTAGRGAGAAAALIARRSRPGRGGPVTFTSGDAFAHALGAASFGIQRPPRARRRLFPRGEPR